MKVLEKTSRYDKLQLRRLKYKRKMKREYTNKRIDKAGQRLVQYNIDDIEIQEDVDIINSWREAHSMALEKLVKLAQKRAKQVGGDSTVVSRLKKMESIKLKLSLANDMQLSRMQDIGGCRTIVDNFEKLVYLYRRIERFHGGFELVKFTDYISHPRSTGYRGFHLIFKDKTKDDEYKILLELQLRTHLQHAWATAVEIAGLFNNSAFKSNQSKGNDEWLRFFKGVSNLFAYDEIVNNNDQVVKDLTSAIKKLDKEHNFIRKLKSYTISTKFINEQRKDNEYFVLALDLKSGILNIHSFKKENLERAQELYFDLESKNSENINAVLVSSSTFESIKDGYLNYFANSNYFITKYQELLKKYS